MPLLWQGAGNMNLIIGQEASEHFMDRIYVDFTRDRVLVFAKNRAVGPAEIWSTEQAKGYLKYLKAIEHNELMV